MDLAVTRHEPPHLCRPQVRDQGCPTSEGQPSPLQGAWFSGVTRKVSSNSIHTLLCSDEHKNPSEDGLRESRPRPLRRTLRRALSLGGKGRGFVRRFSGVENATRCQTDATSCHLRRKRYKRHFFLVYLRQKPTHGSRSGRLHTGIVHPAYSRTIRTSYARRANGYGSPSQRWLVATLGSPSGQVSVFSDVYRTGGKDKRMFAETDNSMYND